MDAAQASITPTFNASHRDIIKNDTTLIVVVITFPFILPLYIHGRATGISNKHFQQTISALWSDEIAT
jgi:hypothetical protein